MNDKEILEGNKLIAEFMGYKFNAYPELKHDNITKPNESEWYYASCDVAEFNRTLEKEIPYHSSWDWLMPVYEKINRIGKIPNPEMPDYILREFNFEILYELGFIESSVHDFSEGDVRRYNIQASAPTTIEAVWLTVIQFLKWHNKKNSSHIYKKK